MLHQQQPQSFDYGAVEPPDIQGWIEITTATALRQEDSGSVNAFTPRPDVEDSSADHALQAGALKNRGALETDSTTRSRPNSEDTCKSKPFAGYEATVDSTVFGDRWEDRRVFSISQQLAYAVGAIKKAESMMDKSPILSSAASELAYLEQRLEGVGQQVKNVVAGASASTLEYYHMRPLRRPASPNTSAGYSDDTLSDVSATSSDVPPVVDMLFDCAREVDVLQDRVSELCLAMGEREAAKSESPESHASPDHQPDIDEARMKVLQRRLVSARDAQAEQRALCLAQGFDPDNFRWRRFSDAGS